MCPIEKVRTSLSEHLGYSRCTVCSSLFKRGTDVKGFQNVVRQKADSSGSVLERAVDQSKGIAYWLFDSEAAHGRGETDSTYRRRYVCPDCTAALFAHLKPAKGK